MVETVYGTKYAATKGRARGGVSPKHGSLNPKAKTDERVVSQILSAASSGASVGDLASMYGLSERIVRRIVERKTWLHVRADDLRPVAS